MNEALLIALSFPTVPLSTLLAFVVIYWLLAATGIIEMDAVDGWVDLDVGDLVHSHAHPHVDADSSITPSGIAGLITRFGLSGVPFMVSLSIITFFAWAFTYYVHLFFLAPMPQGLRWAFGLGVMLGSFIPAVLLAAVVLKPIRWAFSKLTNPECAPSTVLGKEGIVSSAVVDGGGGRVEVPDGGAGLIFQAKSLGGKTYARGDAVIIISHDAENHTYEIISKEEFYLHK